MRAAAAIVEAQLPADLRDSARIYDTKGVARLLAKAAELYPDDYGRIIKSVADAGRNASYRLGVTVGLDDMDSPLDKAPFLAKMDAELDMVRTIAGLTPAERRAKKQEIMGRYSDLLEKEVMNAGNARGNNVTKAVSSGARGKPPQAKALIGAAGVYAGFDGGIIPIFARQSYAEGVRPAAYLASTYGARSAVVSTKVATARGGDLGKQTSQTMSDMLVTVNDCGTDNGIDLASDDNSLSGRVLASSFGGYPAGTFIDTRVAEALKKKGGTILARSALTCTAKHGVCAKCAGASFGNRKLPSIGDNVGVRAANALTEPVTQAALNVKHCILEGTMVRMADLTTKAIQDVRPGDMVLGSDINGNAFPVKVTHVWDQGMQDVIKFTYAQGQTNQRLELFCTADHPVLSSDLVDAAPRKIPAGISSHAVFAVTSTGELALRMSEEPIGRHQCWDISVDHPDELFVLENGLIVKNTAGAHKGRKVFSGLNYITQFVQAPAEFADRAAVAETDGMIDSVEDAPQGGKYVRIGEHTHYVLPGFEVTVKPGDTVEAGDTLSDGLVDPKDIIRYKGLGEGRRYYAERFKKILDDSGHTAHSRNTELMARAAIDHVHIDNDDGYGDYLPGDTASYNTIVNRYTPPETSQLADVAKSEGKFLAAPLLHYSIGTRITPSVSKRLSSVGFNEALVDDAPPPFSPSMTRLRTQGEDDDDWLDKQRTSYIKSNIADDAVRGRDTNILENRRFAPRMAYGVGYGKNLTANATY